MSATSPLSPRDRRLDEVVASLGAQSCTREVIRLVETWAAAGTPTVRARLEEARAFFHLRLMDRAMARAREVVEATPEDAAAQYLLAEIYIERGWPSHARKIVSALREGAGAPLGLSGRGGDLDDLSARAQAEPVRLSAQAAAIEAEGDPARVQQLAEYFLTTGSYFRARSLLERLRRSRPDERRVLDLLWGLDGQFTDKERGLEALLEECAALLPAPSVAPAPSLLPVARPGEIPREAERTEAGDGGGEGEHTESRRLADASEGGEGGEVASFPALFKHAARARADEGDSPLERTAMFSLASRAEMAAGMGEDTDPEVQVAPVRVSRVEDTQIMLVLRPGEKQGGARPMHVRREDEAAHNNLRETLNLREWQQSMGVLSAAEPRPEERPAGRAERRSDPSDLDRSDLERGPEEEENVVVVKRAAPAEPAPAEPSGLRKRPIEVIEKIPLPPPPAPAATPVTPEPEPEIEPTGEHPVQPPAPDIKALTRVLLAIGALMLMGLVALLALALYLQR